MCFFEKSESDYLVYHLSDAVRVRTFRGLQSVDCRKLGFFLADRRCCSVVAGITGSVLLARVYICCFLRKEVKNERKFAGIVHVLCRLCVRLRVELFQMGVGRYASLVPCIFCMP